MKSLAEVEPRTPISALPFTISTAGSYYLTANLTAAAGGAGISITAGSVTLDLGGFTLTGNATSGSGVVVGVSGSEVAHVTIKNGALVGWQFFGVDARYGNSMVFTGLSGGGNYSGGTGNGGGLYIGDDSLVQDCTFSGTGNGFRITGEHNRLVNCRASYGTSAFYTEAGLNTFTSCTAVHAGAGFDVWARDVVRDCEVIDCTFGVTIGSAGAVKNCVVRGIASTAEGITIFGTGAVVESNIVSGHTVGIKTETGAAGALIIKNWVSQSSVRNFEILAGNKVAEIVSAPASGAISGNTGGAGVGTSTNPWANISY
jgi:hypothetical protein